MNALTKTYILAIIATFFVGSLILAGDYQWPLKIPPKLSSQFGDYRSGHWHAGIDITTRAKTGYKVYAVSDGYIYRIKTSYWGYGKALYLKFKDGRYAVYGHLARFGHDVEDYVRKQQVKSRQYYHDIFLKPGQFPVKKGDYIALSGQSGAGAPHLHLEIRDQNNLLLNPLDGFFSIKDTRPPILDHLVLKRYKTIGIGNYHEIEFLPVSKSGDNYLVEDTIIVDGQVVFALSGYDPNGGYNYGLFGIDMYLDSVRVFGIKKDKLDYATGNQIDYVKDHGLKAICDRHFGRQNDNDKHVFYKLYIQPYDDQLFYDDFKYPAGVICADSLDGGIHTLQIVFYDVNNNSRKVTAYIQKADLPRPSIESMRIYNDTLEIKSPELNENRFIEIQYRDKITSPYKTIPARYDIFSDLTSVTIKKNISDFRLRVDANGRGYSPWVVFDPRVNSESVKAYADYLDLIISNEERVMANETPIDQYYTLALPHGYTKSLVPLPVRNGYFALDLQDETGNHSFYKFNSGGFAYSPDSTVRVLIDKNHLYDPLVIQISNPRQDKGIYTFEITPKDALLRNAATIEFNFSKYNINLDKYSLYYYWEPKSRWIYIGNGKKGVLEGRTFGGGRFAVIADVNAPYIGNLRPRHNRATSDRTPYLSCRVEDKLSGIKKESQLEMTIDGVWVPAYYDIDTKEFGYQVRNPLKRTTHTLRVKATDNQGNVSVKTSRFTIK